MSDSYRNMLRKVLVALPQEERLAFLREVVASLKPAEREKLLVNISSPQPPVARPPVVVAAPAGGVMPPKRTAPTAPVVSPPEAPPAPASRKPSVAAGIPPASTLPGVTSAKPELAGGKGKPVQRDDDYYKMRASNEAISPAKMRKQLIGLLAMGVGGLLLLAGLAVVMAKVWEWIKSLF